MCTVTCAPREPKPVKKKGQAEQEAYDLKLATITCDCGYGYFRGDGTWVSGADVRAGLLPMRDGSMVQQNGSTNTADSDT